MKLEEIKYVLEYDVAKKDFEVSGNCYGSYGRLLRHLITLLYRYANWPQR